MRQVRCVPEVAEDEQVDAHQDERWDQHPHHAEDGALVAGVQIPSEQASEQLAVADQIRVDRHLRGLVYGGAGTASRTHTSG